MANTMPRAIRIPEDLWHAAKAKAHREGKTLTDVVIAALQIYLDDEPYTEP